MLPWWRFLIWCHEKSHFHKVCIDQMFVDFVTVWTPSWFLKGHCWAAVQFLFPGMSLLVLEVVSWQLSQWAATARCCSFPLLPFLCWLAEWITAMFTCGLWHCRCCGKPLGIFFCSTRSITCKSPCASGTQLWRVDDHKHKLKRIRMNKWMCFCFL